MNKKINIKIFRSEVQFLTEQILMNKAIFQMCIISTFELKKCLKSKKFFNFNCLSNKFYNKKKSFHEIQKIKKAQIKILAGENEVYKNSNKKIMN